MEVNGKWIALLWFYLLIEIDFPWFLSTCHIDWHSYLLKEFIPFSDTLLFCTGMASHFCTCAFTVFCLFVLGGVVCIDVCLWFSWLVLEFLDSHLAWPCWEYDFNSKRCSNTFQISILDQKTRKLASCICVIEANLSVDCVKWRNNCHFEN